jgi:predicted ATPase/DNA-binding CsgD family transcriptional regulator
MIGSGGEGTARASDGRTPPRGGAVGTGTRASQAQAARTGLRVLVPTPTNLPVTRTALIDRDDERSAVSALLRRDHVRLVTLTGIGGSGKTRLALAVAAGLLEDFPDGVWFVDLVPERDVDGALCAIAAASGTSRPTARPTAVGLVESLREKVALLVLDNAEHLPDTGQMVSDLLDACPTLRVLATSREPLHVYGEREFPVPPLCVPDLSRVDRRERTAALVQAVQHNPAVALFLERARSVAPHFELTDDNMDSVVEICRRLDGLPLAIELAAGRVRLLPPQAMLDRLSDRMAFLTGGPLDRPVRQQTMRAAMAWSYELLDPVEQLAFRRLGVFAGGFSLPAAAAVCGLAADADESALDIVEALGTRNLLRLTPGAGPEPRYAMLDTVRDYALEMLAAVGESDEARARHARFFLAMAEAQRIEGFTGAQTAWLRQLTVEHDNLWAAMAWLRDADDVPAALRMASALWLHAWLDGHLASARAWFDALLPRREAASFEIQAWSLGSAGIVAHLQADYEHAEFWLREALTLGRTIGDKRCTAMCLGALAAAAERQGDYPAADRLYAESLQLLRELGNPGGMAVTLSNHAGLLVGQGRLAEARMLYLESLSLLRDGGSLPMVAIVLGHLGNVECSLGRCDLADPLFDEMLGIARSLGQKQGIAQALARVGRSRSRCGSPTEASALLGESVELFDELGDKWGLSRSLERLGVVGTMLGAPERGALLLAAAEELRGSIGAPLMPADFEDHDANLERARAALGAAVFDETWKAGSRLAVADAVAVARDLVAFVERSGPGLELAAARARGGASADWGGLTPREREVAALIAAGMSYRDIADELSVTAKTIEKHVGNILAKLGLENRSQIVVWAQHRGLGRQVK